MLIDSQNGNITQEAEVTGEKTQHKGSNLEKLLGFGSEISLEDSQGGSIQRQTEEKEEEKSREADKSKQEVVEQHNS